MNVDSIFEQFSNKKIAVLGDVMIDAYLRGGVSRISPEAPVPIIELQKAESRLGGAANVALNLLSLGAQPIICSLIGDDDGGTNFMDLLNEKSLPLEGIILDKQRKTTIKTRVIGDNQHLLRIDDEEVSPINSNQENSVIDRVKKILDSKVDALIIEDYNKGLLTEKVIETVIDYANELGIIVTVDPKRDNFFAYKNVTLFKPNLKELKEGLNVVFNLETGKTDFEMAINKLEERLNNKISLITLSEHGVFIKKNDEMNYTPAHLRKISDVSGAGDTVISVATLCLTVGLEVKKIAEISNLAGGLVCELSGVVPINKDRLKEEVFKIT